MGAEFVYACARVRSNEKYLLSKDKLNNMIEAKTMEDACKILQDAGYGSEGEVIQPLLYEQTLVKETTKLYDFIFSIAPEQPEFRVFAYPFDYHNIKVLLKAEILGTGDMNILMEGGTISPAVMSSLVKERNYMPMTVNMKHAIEDAMDTHARTRDPQCIDLILDKYCYADIREVADKSGNAFLQGYIRLLIDTINLKTFARVRKTGQTWTYFSEVCLPGGNIDEKTFVAGYDEPMNQFAVRLTSYALGDAAEGGSAGLKESGSFTELEKLCDNALIRYVKGAKAYTFGLEPLIAYVVAKQMEIKCVRIILAGKAVGIESSRIRERLREAYE